MPNIGLLFLVSNDYSQLARYKITILQTLIMAVLSYMWHKPKPVLNPTATLAC